MTLATTSRPDELMAALRRLTGDEKHAPAAFSTLDVIWVLYDRVLRVDPARTDDPDRDRFLLSKGHGPAAYYAVLATEGFFPAEWLDDLAGPDSRLGHHPDRNLVPGVEISSGSLGHGLGLAIGTALGLRAQGLTSPVGYPRLAGRDRQSLRCQRLEHHGRGRPRPRRHRPWIAQPLNPQAARGRGPRRTQVLIGVVMRETFIHTTTALLDDDPRTSRSNSISITSGWEPYWSASAPPTTPRRRGAPTSLRVTSR
jgi:hypothetical protein